MIKGQCNCGAIEFEAKINAPDIFWCHCSICRKATGVNGITVLIARKENLRWIRGEHLISTWKKPDADWQTWFCKICGAPLPGENDGATVFIPAGVVTESDENLAVAHHIWVDSRAEWDHIGDAGVQHPEAFQGPSS